MLARESLLAAQGGQPPQYRPQRADSRRDAHATPRGLPQEQFIDEASYPQPGAVCLAKCRARLRL